MKYLKLAMLPWLIWSWPAHATLDLAALETPGWQEFVRGDFYAALSKGRAANTANGYALACRSGLTLGGFLEKEEAAIRLLHEAVADCQKALQKEPGHYFAKMSLSIALSFEGKRLKRVAYAKQAKAHIEELITAEPGNALGYGALAAWHTEVSAAGFWARMILGARRKLAKRYFEKALEMGAMDFPLQFEYVKFLARGNKAARAKALKAADKLMRQSSPLAIDKIILQKCTELRAILQAGRKKAILKAVNDASAFKDVEKMAHLKALPLESSPQSISSSQ